VRNPDLPAVVPINIPSCCIVLARKSIVPQHNPPINSIFLSPAFCGFLGEGLTLSIAAITGISTIPPIIDLTQLKVNGPTILPPCLCATNELPQISAVRTINNEFLNLVFFIISAFRTSVN